MSFSNFSRLIAIRFPVFGPRQWYAYDEKKAYGKAISDYTKAIRLKPDYAAAYKN